MGQNRGATSEAINALPTYKYKSKKSENGEESDINLENQGEGGILAAGTDKERTISAEDAVSFLYISNCTTYYSYKLVIKATLRVCDMYVFMYTMEANKGANRNDNIIVNGATITRDRPS